MFKHINDAELLLKNMKCFYVIKETCSRLCTEQKQQK